MSHKTRLTKLEKIGLGDTLWALIGVGRPRDIQHQRSLEMQARENFYASGGNRGAYLAFLRFDSFLGYIKKGQLDLMITNKTKNSAESYRFLCPNNIFTWRVFIKKIYSKNIDRCKLVS